MSHWVQTWLKRALNMDMVFKKLELKAFTCCPSGLHCGLAWSSLQPETVIPTRQPRGKKVFCVRWSWVGLTAKLQTEWNCINQTKITNSKKQKEVLPTPTAPRTATNTGNIHNILQTCRPQRTHWLIGERKLFILKIKLSQWDMASKNTLQYTGAQLPSGL